MCGIVGIIAKDRLINPENSLYSMLSSIIHRGQDGDGIYLTPEGRVALGHRRLSIIDPLLSVQPMHYFEYGLTITFNGCIYNYIELRTELVILGHNFKTSGDTEVILKSYAQWGFECLKKFNGIFAFAIWDAKKQLLFCARDRIGVKPFYYYYNNNILYFCSEIKGLLKTDSYTPGINYDALNNYFNYQFYLGNETLFNNIFELEAGTYLIFKDNNLSIKNYWSIDDFEEDESLAEDKAVSRLYELLIDTMSINLRSDVSIGAYLSGGFDSSSIVLLSNFLKHKQLQLFTGAFSGEEYDESNYAKIIAKHTGYDHHITYFKAEDFIKNIRKIIWHMDQPEAGIGVFPQYMISKKAQSHVKVVLGGQGGDELFVGYTRYFIMMISEGLNQSNKQKFISHFINNNNIAGYEDYFISFVNRSSDNNLNYPNNYFYLLQRSNSLFKQTKDSTAYERFIQLFNTPRLSPIKKILRFDIKTHLKALLHVDDRVSMAHSLESRVPLLDHRLVEFMMTVPSKLLYQGNPKSLFKAAMNDLMIGAIKNRTDKKGFPVPFNQWVHVELKDFLFEIFDKGKLIDSGLVLEKDLKLSLSSTKGFNRELWGALCLELWLQEFM